MLLWNKSRHFEALLAFCHEQIQQLKAGGNIQTCTFSQSKHWKWFRHILLISLCCYSTNAVPEIMNPEDCLYQKSWKHVTNPGDHDEIRWPLLWLLILEECFKAAVCKLRPGAHFLPWGRFRAIQQPEAEWGFLCLMRAKLLSTN